MARVGEELLIYVIADYASIVDFSEGTPSMKKSCGGEKRVFIYKKVREEDMRKTNSNV